MGTEAQELRRSIFEEPSEIIRPQQTTFMDERRESPSNKFVKDISLQSKMLTRLSRKTAAKDPGRRTSINQKIRVSPYMPRKINGDFKGLVAVNPGRTRVTVDQSAMSNE